MMPPPWYWWLQAIFYSVIAWTPVVHRRGTWWDHQDRLGFARASVEDALDDLEHHGEDGLHAARAALYAVLNDR